MIDKFKAYLERIKQFAGALKAPAPVVMMAAFALACFLASPFAHGGSLPYFPFTLATNSLPAGGQNSNTTASVLDLRPIQGQSPSQNVTLLIGANLGTTNAGSNVVVGFNCSKDNVNWTTSYPFQFTATAAGQSNFVYGISTNFGAWNFIRPDLLTTSSGTTVSTITVAAGY